MYYFLAKFLPLLFMPLAVALVLLIATTVLMLKNKKSAGLTGLVLAILVLYMHAVPFTVNRLSQAWEGRPDFTDPPDSSASAIVVLGGFVERLPEFPDRVFFGGGIDRLIEGIRLFKAGKASILVLSGGVYPGENHSPEAYAMRDFAVRVAGLPDSVLMLDARSANTGENAIFTALKFDSLGWEKKIILITSASHMHRAEFQFRKAGFDPYLHRTDFNTNAFRDQRFPFVLVPTAENLHYCSRIYREMFGYLYLKLRAAF